MKKKWRLILLALIVVFTMTLVYISFMPMGTALQRGTAEDLRALSGWDGSEPVCNLDEDADFYSGWYNDVWAYLGDLEETAPLQKVLGGARWNRDERRMYIYVTEPTQQLRDQIQQEKRCKYTQIVLAKCDYTLNELVTAEEKLTDWLTHAPESVKDSVQFYIILPKQNRIAVWVKDWSDGDHAAMARAMGADCGKFFLAEGDLAETAKNVSSITSEDWDAAWQQWSEGFDRKEASEQRHVSEEEAQALFGLKEEKTAERQMYRGLYRLIYDEDDWRMRVFFSFGQLSVTHAVDAPVYAHFAVGSLRETTMPDQTTRLFYERWEEKHENMVRAFFSHEFPEHGFAVILYPRRYYNDLPF